MKPRVSLDGRLVVRNLRRNFHGGSARGAPAPSIRSTDRKFKASRCTTSIARARRSKRPRIRRPRRLVLPRRIKRYNRIPFFYANASLSQQVTKNTRLDIGVLNLFGSISSKVFTTGVGPYIAENRFGGDANSFQHQTPQTPVTATVSITTRI